MKKWYALCLFTLTLSLLAGRTKITQEELLEVGASEKDEIAECLNQKFKAYNPPHDIQATLKEIFSNSDFFTLLETEKSPKYFLESLGFKIMQFRNPTDTVVVEHPKLPGYVIKFMRISAPKGMLKTRLRGVFPTPVISDRVVHAQEIRQIIKNKNLHYVTVPQKYFYCIGDVAIVAAQKIQPSHRTLKDLNDKEIKEILTLAVSSEGLVDLRPRNIILTQNKIFFIDTEHRKNQNWWELIKKFLPQFKKEIHRRYHYMLDRFKKTQDQKAYQRKKLVSA